MKFKIFAVLATTITIFGCGDGSKSGNPKIANDEATAKIQLQGNVVSAFTLTVDNTSYDDIEDYYSYVSMNLNNMVSELGYDDYEASFEAELGFSDLTNNMIVYLSPVSNSGFQSRTVDTVV